MSKKTKKTVIELDASASVAALNANTNVTKITELNISLEPDTISYLDEAKRQKKAIVTMLSSHTNSALGESTNVHCWWCRHSFTSMPIGCPIRYVPNQIEKEYTSEITKDNYVIRENLDMHFSKDNFTSSENITYKFYEKDYYETDGVFCSFNCCMAYILDNKHVSFYKNAENLLCKIYFDLVRNKSTIIAAPSWKLLRAYGGHLSIEDFRKTFNKIEYKEAGQVFNVTKFRSVGTLFEEKTRL